MNTPQHDHGRDNNRDPARDLSRHHDHAAARDNDLAAARHVSSHQRPTAPANAASQAAASQATAEQSAAEHPAGQAAAGSAGTSSLHEDDVSSDPRVLAVELLISRTLRLGVVISLVLMGIGVGLGVIQNTSHQTKAAHATAADAAVSTAAAVSTTDATATVDTTTTDAAATAAATDADAAAATTPTMTTNANATTATAARMSSQPVYLPDLWTLPLDFLRLDGRAWMTAGLLVLIATPVIRVAMSVLLFLRMRDRTFTAITLFVLAMLILSYFLGHGK